MREKEVELVDILKDVILLPADQALKVLTSINKALRAEPVDQVRENLVIPEMEISTVSEKFTDVREVMEQRALPKIPNSKINFSGSTEEPLGLTDHPEPIKSTGVLTSDHPPCQCGSTEFLRTGTCHVCLVCGSSQGCS